MSSEAPSEIMSRMPPRRPQGGGAGPECVIVSMLSSAVLEKALDEEPPAGIMSVPVWRFSMLGQTLDEEVVLRGCWSKPGANLDAIGAPRCWGKPWLKTIMC